MPSTSTSLGARVACSQVGVAAILLLMGTLLLGFPHLSSATARLPLPVGTGLSSARLLKYSRDARFVFIWGQPFVSMYVRYQTGQCGVYNNLTYLANITAYQPDGRSQSPIFVGLNTMYGGVCMDLSLEPVVVQLPAIPNRYYSCALYNSYGDFVAVNSSRTNPGGSINITYYGPTTPQQQVDQLPAGSVRSNTVATNLLIRIAVYNLSDVPNILALWQKVRIAPLSLVDQSGDTTRNVTTLPGLSGQPDPIRNMIIIDHFFRMSPPPEKTIGNTIAIRKLSSLGIHANSSTAFDPAALSPAKRSALIRAGNWANKTIRTAGVAAGLNDLFGTGSSRTNRWLKSRTPETEEDHFLARAFWATKGFLFANPPSEAEYLPCARDASGKFFHGSKRYVLRTDPPRVLAFWSVALYDATGFFPDGLDKRQVGSFDTGVKYDADGKVTIYISKDPPSQDKIPNWIPTPNTTFTLLMRAYNILDPSYYPAAVRECRTKACWQ